MKIRLNIDPVKYDKKPTQFYAAIRNRLCKAERIKEIDPDKLLEIVQQGRTFTPAAMTGTTGDTWQSQQIISADIDNDSGEKDEAGNKIMISSPLLPAEALDVMRNYDITPYFMYWTFSNTEAWPKFRVVLVLDEPLTDAAEAADLTLRLAGIFNKTRAQCADTSVFDPARYFCGGRADCVFYNARGITSAQTLRNLPKVDTGAKPKEKTTKQGPAQAATPSTQPPRQQQPNKGRDLQTLEAQLRADIASFDLASYIQETTDSTPVYKGAHLYLVPCPICRIGGLTNGGSFNVTGALWHCFSAHHKGKTGGTIIDYLMELYNISVGDALEKFKFEIMKYDRDEWKQAYKNSVRSTPDDDFIDPIDPEAAQGPAQAQTEAPDFLEYYEQCMLRFGESQEAQDYVTRRGISIDVATAPIPAADNCTIGFDPKWINPNTVRKMRAAGSNWRPTPTPRLIIPVTPYHYVARDIRDPDTLTGAAQENYKKFRVQNATATDAEPVAISNAEALYSGADYVFITEGPFDAMSYAEAGQPAISLNSLDNKDKLIAQLEQQPSTATLLLSLDNDKPGKEATAYLRQELKRRNISFIGVNTCGTHKDPNEALCADRAAFEQAIAKAVAGTAARPDNTATYLDNEMPDEIKKFKDAQNRRTGFSNIDEKAGGLYPGLYVLAAISSLGKTTLALQMADQIAEAGQDVLFFSMEQSRLELVSKSLARITAQNDITNAVTSLSIRRGYLPLAVQNAAEQYKAQTGGRESIIEGNFNCDIGYITDYIHLYQQRTGTAPVVFIDYLQILQPTDEGKSKLSKREEIGKAVTELKRLSREGLTIIVISSLNRANYLTPIAFESLKESGDIEYTADVVWGLQLACLDEDEVFEAEGKIKKKRKAVEKAKAENPRKITFTCLKNRYGISSYDCRFYYYPQFDLFVPTMDTGSAPSQARRNTAKDVAGGVIRK